MNTNYWTPEEDLVLHRLVAEGVDDAAIGRQIRRSPMGIAKRRSKLGLHRQPTKTENDQPWEPPPGMVKRRCDRCNLWFATPRYAQRSQCLDCGDG